MANDLLMNEDTLLVEKKLALKILFVVNAGSGNDKIDWPKEIETYYQSSNHAIEFFYLDKDFEIDQLKEKINQLEPNTVVAVGGDGTVCLVAECLLQKNISLGILPAGSANGLAKELGISEVPKEALQTISDGVARHIHAVRVNDKLCIHLSDIGFNAYMLKKFESENVRGMKGYLKASIKAGWSVLFSKQAMPITLTLGKKIINTRAVMIVIANATKYGSGAVINPMGSLEDDLFEVIVLKKISVVELFKMLVSHSAFNPAKTEVFQTNQLVIQPKGKVHFQVDGEYLGKVNKVEATLMPSALKIIMPTEVKI